MDLPNIKIAVQWKATCDLCTLWQCFGGVVCGQDVIGTAILLVGKKNIDKEWLAKAKRVAKQKTKGAGMKWKAIGIGNHEKAKWPALVDQSLNRGQEEVSGNASLEDNTNVSADRGPELDAVVDPG